MEIIPTNGGKASLMKETPYGSGKYEIVVEPGEYKVFVKKVGYRVLEEIITTKAGIYTIQLNV